MDSARPVQSPEQWSAVPHSAEAITSPLAGFLAGPFLCFNNSNIARRSAPKAEQPAVQAGQTGTTKPVQ
jgi:hypothetical protein